MSEAFAPYEEGLRKLRQKLGDQHEELQPFLNYEHRLRANIQLARLYGDTPTLKAERNQIVDQLNALAHQIAGRSFNEMCGLAPRQVILTTKPRQIPLPVVLLLNLLAIGVLAALLWPSPLSWLSSILPWLSCISPLVSAPSLALILLLVFHLVWRHGKSVFMTSGGKVGLRGITIPIREIALLVDIVHPYRLSDRVLWILGAFLFAAATVFGFTPLSPFPPPQEETPIVHSLSIEFLERGDTTTLRPDDRVELIPGEQVLVQAQSLGRQGTLCRWSALSGGLQPAEGCATIYNAPFNKTDDVLSVSTQSPCKTQRACASLHITIRNP